jgi:putative tricarboxylic transport membrane protein
MEDKHESAQAGARVVLVDLIVAALIFLLGALVAYDSHRLGSSWGADGPQAGYFPFYIGLLICICCVVVMGQSLARLGSDRKVFVTTGRLKQVLVILVPSFLYVAGIQVIGLYVPSAVFIVFFMKFVGKYGWLRSAVVGVTISLAAFLLFEIWFKIPLPKGPVERLLGY